ncbi:YcdB/YcdC domain-containing protein [Ruminiclostridium papyrosolvens]|uniref:Peptidase M4 n=1 Tax=Ruminiclostridium papyrosolvens C7 TaxID=1330534 RepID=U4QYY1_9FIRM|nr:YcdB/YcdC domain-containing protein [Ruminiclostridium papyrosolvens]EPR09288.1 peptidase M4 [Ruminiclostridium papyrosolvens C7]
MKRFISMLLVVAVLAVFMIPAMAADGSAQVDKELQNAIKFVKSKIDIPKECTKFSYNIYNRNDQIVWSLAWSDEDSQKNVNVQVDEDNFISSYNTYDYMPNVDKKIPKYSKEQAYKIAEQFVNSLNPKLMDEFKLNETNAYGYNGGYNINYIRQVNGIKFRSNYINLSVNSYTGKVISYTCNYSKNAKFEDASKIISLNQAQKSFAEKLGLKLVYNVKFENDKPETYLSYVPKATNKYIDAVTGEVETATNYRLYENGASSQYEKLAIMDAAGTVSNIALTPDELEAVNDISNLITKDTADKKLRSISNFNLDSSFKLTNAYLGKDWRNSNSLAWTLAYTKVLDESKKLTRELQITVDAKTGALIEFWANYMSPTGAVPQKSVEQAKSICDETLKALMPDIYTKVKYDDSYITYDSKPENSYRFKYIRMENGVECPDNYISISYDNLSGNIDSFYTYWSKELKFADPKNVITVEEANKVLFNKIGYGIQYIPDDSDEADTAIEDYKLGIINTKNAVLGYFTDNSKPCNISAVNGDVLDSSGRIYKDDKVADYTDINGIKAEDKVRILTQMGIRYIQDELKPADVLLQKDYFVLLSKLNDFYYMDKATDNDKIIENMYSQLIAQGIITKAEKAPLSVITREEAAKYFIKFKGLSEVAEIKGIYKSSFKDANKINQNLLGYVCLATGFKAMNGSNGNFMPKNKMTRLDGLMTIYNFLAAK